MIRPYYRSHWRMASCSSKWRKFCTSKIVRYVWFAVSMFGQMPARCISYETMSSSGSADGPTWDHHPAKLDSKRIWQQSWSL